MLWHGLACLGPVCSTPRVTKECWKAMSHTYSLPSRRRNYNTMYNDKFWTVKIKVKKSQREEGSVSWWPSMPYVLLFGYTKRKSWSRVRWQQMRLLRDVEEIGLISARRVTGDIRAGSVAGASYPPPRLPNPIPLISPRCQPQSTPDTALSSLSLANRLRWKLITFVTDAAQHDWTLQPTSTSWTSSVRRDWQINSSLWRLFARKMLQIIWVDKKTKSPMVNFFTK